MSNKPLLSPQDIQAVNTGQVPAVSQGMVELAKAKAAADAAYAMAGPQAIQLRTLQNIAESMVAKLPPGIGMMAHTSHHESFWGNNHRNEVYAMSLGVPLPIQTSGGWQHVIAMHGRARYWNNGNPVQVEFEEKDGKLYMYLDAS